MVSLGQELGKAKIICIIKRRELSFQIAIHIEKGKKRKRRQKGGGGEGEGSGRPCSLPCEKFSYGN